MKKVLAWVLAFALVLGTFATAFAANSSETTYSDISGQKCEGAVAVLSALDVVKGYPDGTYKPANIVTRAEMVTLIIRALDLSKYAQGTTSNYSDVTATHWAAADIAYATSMGVIQGYPDGTFKPEATVTYQEALTMVIRALGYKDEYLIGSWPANFVNQARTLNLLDNIDTIVGGANRGDVAIILYNALNKQMVTYDTNGNQTLLDTSSSMLARLDATEEDGVIDMQLAKDAIVDINDFFGKYVHYWINDDDEVLVVEETYSTTLTGDLTNDSGTYSFDTGSKEYDFTEAARSLTGDCERDMTTTGHDPHDAMFFLNGEEVGALTSLNDNAGVYEDVEVAVTISGNKITDIYAVSQWEPKATYQWDADFADDLNDNQKIDAYEFNLNDDDAVDEDAFFLYGVDSLSNIKDDNIVTVYADAHDMITKVEVGTQTVKGEVEEIVEDDGDYIATIAGKDYNVGGTNYIVDDFDPATYNDFTDSVAYLNYKGDVANIESDDSIYHYAIYLAYATDADYSDAGDQYSVKLYTADGTKTFKFESDLNDEVTADVINGVDLANDGLPATLVGPDYAGTMVVYTLDDNGDIDSFDTAEDNTLSTAKTMTSKGILDGKVVSKDVVVFYPDGDVTDFDWTDSDYAALEDQELAANTVYVLEDGEIVAIKCIEDLKGTDNMFAYFVSASEVTTSTKYYEKAKLLTGGSENTLNTVKFSSQGALIFRGLTPDTNALLYVTCNKDKEITAAALADLKTATEPTDTFGAKDGAVYTSGSPAVVLTTDGTYDFYQVGAKNASNSILYLAGMDQEDNAQFVGNATFYKWNADDEKMAPSKLSEISKGDAVLLVQTDEDNEEWDLVVIVDADDIASF